LIDPRVEEMCFVGHYMSRRLVATNLKAKRLEWLHGRPGSGYEEAWPGEGRAGARAESFREGRAIIMDEPLTMEPQEPQPKRRNPWLAGLGNLVFPPLGHVYAGRAGRGVLLYAGVTAIELSSIWVAARSVRLTSLILLLALVIAGVIWRIADAAMVARWRRRDAALTWYQRWYIYLATIPLSYYLTAGTVFVFRTYLAQAYYMPSGSMIPTLLIGDRFIIDKLTYRWNDPVRSDIVVFRAPPVASPDEKDFVKRVIGLPGDTVAVAPDTLLVDGKPAVELNDDPGGTDSDFLHSRQRGLRWGRSGERLPRVQGNILYDNGEPRVLVTSSGQAERRDSRFEVRQTDRITVTNDLAPFGAAAGVTGSVYYLGEAAQPTLIVLRGKRLTLRPGWVSINGRPLKEPYARETPRYEMPPYRIPARCYFVLGDNRNDSNDSHAWGPVSRDRISGVAHMIYWSEQPERIGRALR
jgi:signal peptidase I